MNTNERLPLQQRVNARLRDDLARALGSAQINHIEMSIIADELRSDLGLASQELQALNKDLDELRAQVAEQTEADEDEFHNRDPDEDLSGSLDAPVGDPEEHD